MGQSRPPVRSKRVLMAVAVIASLLVGFFAFAPGASAHHPEIDGAVDCGDGGGYVVSFLSESWQKSGGNSGGGANPSIRISYRLRTDGGSSGPWIDLPADPAYRYTSQNGYQFSDDFPVADLSGGNQVQLRATAVANWGNGQPGGQQTSSAWIPFPDDCTTPGVPAVEASTVCVSGDGEVTLTLTNTAGDEPIEFVVTDPRTQVPTTVTVAPGQSQTVVLSGFADGAYTIGVTADGEPYDQQVLVACDVPGTPQVDADVECVDGDGDVVVALANTAGTEPIEFVVTDPRTGVPTTVTVAPGQSDSVVLEGFADGSYTIGVTADGVSLDRQVEVDCDRPGTPQVDADVECVDGDGDVVLLLSNTAGDVAVEFVVTDPRGGATITRTVGVGQSVEVVLEGFADGPHTIGVTADGVAIDQTVLVDCDRPGVPEVDVDPDCVGADGEVVVLLSNTGGDLPVEFVVTDPRDGSTTTRTVAVGQSVEVVLEGFDDGTYTIGITADGQSLDRDVEIACDVPGVPEVVAGTQCVDGDGDVVVALGNVGGNQPVRFVVVDPRDGSEIRRRVKPGGAVKVVLEGFADGSYTIPVRADRVPMDQQVVVDCDRPGEPHVDVDPECVDGDGDVVVVLSNTGGDLPVEFVVTDPRDGSTITRTVAVGQSVEVVLEGFADGDYTIGITADGQSLDRDVEIACDVPGEPAVDVSTDCVEFDGQVVVTLANTGGTEPIEFVVTDPRDGSTITRNVAVGSSVEVVLEGLPDGTHTIEVTADGVSLDQQVVVDCDRPGDPAASATTECAADGGQVAITLENRSLAGEAEPVIFVVTDPRDGSEQAEVVAAGSSTVVVLEGFDEGGYTIEVTADGEPLASLDVEVDCGLPYTDGITLECTEGGAIVTVGNAGTVPVELDVLVDDVPVAILTVPAGDTSEVFLPLDEDQAVNIKVLEGETVLLDTDVDFDCEEPPVVTTTVTTPTTDEPGIETRVLSGSTELATPAAQVQAASGPLPVTGGGLGLVGVALVLLTAGAMVLWGRRRMVH